MYEIRVRSRFEAAHHLTSYRGAPESAHGHSWEVEVEVACPELDEDGLGIDFVEVKGSLDALSQRLHGHDINVVAPFDKLSPSAENLARWFFEELAAALPGVPLASLTVWEAPGCSVTYRP